MTQIRISWFCKISSLAGQEWSNSQFQAKFSTRLKISGFCQISSFAGLEWSKIYFWAKFSTQIKIFLDFAKFHPLQVRSSQTLDLKPNFQRNWKFLDFAKFHPSQVWSGQKSHFWAKFSTQIKIFLDFVKFHPSWSFKWWKVSILS